VHAEMHLMGAYPRRTGHPIDRAGLRKACCGVDFMPDTRRCGGHLPYASFNLTTRSFPLEAGPGAPWAAFWQDSWETDPRATFSCISPPSTLHAALSEIERDNGLQKDRRSFSDRCPRICRLPGLVTARKFSSLSCCETPLGCEWNRGDIISYSKPGDQRVEFVAVNVYASSSMSSCCWSMFAP